MPAIINGHRFLPSVTRTGRLVCSDESGRMVLSDKGLDAGIQFSRASEAWSFDGNGIAHKFGAHRPLYRGGIFVDDNNVYTAPGTENDPNSWPWLETFGALTNAIPESHDLSTWEIAAGQPSFAVVPGLDGTTDQESFATELIDNSDTSRQSVDSVVTGVSGTFIALRVFWKKNHVSSHGPDYGAIRMFEEGNAAGNDILVGIRGDQDFAETYLDRVIGFGDYFDMYTYDIPGTDWVATVITGHCLGFNNLTVRLFGAFFHPGWILDTGGSAVGSIVFGNVELYVDKDFQELRRIGPVFTNGAAATVASTSFRFNAALLPTQSGHNKAAGVSMMHIPRRARNGERSILSVEESPGVISDVMYSNQNLINEPPFREYGDQSGGPLVVTFTDSDAVSNVQH